MFFATVTYALRDFSRAKLEDLLAKRNRGKRLESFLEAVPRLILTVSALRMTAVLALILVITSICSKGDDGWRVYAESFGWSCLLLLIFSVAMPNALAKHVGEFVLSRSMGFLSLAQFALGWLATFLNFFDVVTQRLAGVRQTEETQSEEVERDILDAVSEGEQQGVVDVEERQMIESVIAFQDGHVGQIMTPRTEVIAVQADATLDDVKDIIAKEGHSRLPVYDTTVDNVIGMLYAKDLLRHVGNHAPFDVRSIMRLPLFVPDAKSLRDLLHEFQQKQVHLAVVLDEYGGTAGVVTIEDILEELVGEIADEYEQAEPEQIVKLDEHTADLDARVRIPEFNEWLDVELPENHDYDTIGGFLSAKMGRVPAPGENFEYENLSFEVLDAEPRKVNRLRVHVEPIAAEEEAEVE